MDYISNRDYYCPECGGWLEYFYWYEGIIMICDTCDYAVNLTIGKRFKVDNE